MKIAFSFDDGRRNSLKGYSLLSKYNFRGTFHIVTGFIDGSYLNETFGEPMNLSDLKEMKNNGMEISSHGDAHILDNNDFNISFNKLKKWGLLSKNHLGFSVPNSKYSKEDLDHFLKNDKLSYVRVGRNKKCFSFFNKIMFIIYKIFHFQFAYNVFNKLNINYTSKSKVLNSVVIKNYTKSKNVINFIKKHKNDDGTLILMFHSIVDKPQSKWDYSSASFEEIVSFCKTNKICIDSIENIILN